MNSYKAKLDKLQAALKDSVVVHIMILRGDISLTKEQAIHIAGLDADIEKTMDELREHNSQNIESSETAHRAFDNAKVKLTEALRIAGEYNRECVCVDMFGLECNICKSYGALLSSP